MHNSKMLSTIVLLSFLICTSLAGVTEREMILCHTGVRCGKGLDRQLCCGKGMFA